MVMLSVLFLSGCTQTLIKPAVTQPICHSGDVMTQSTLYFGLNRPAGPAITAKEWQQFIDQDVTPRFQEGLSVFDAKGQWLGNDGVLVRENSKALLLIHVADAASQQKIDTLRNIYKQRFAQDSVMRVDTTVCVAF